MNVAWLYCPSEDNLAAISTRDCKASQLPEKWGKGPEWLFRFYHNALRKLRQERLVTGPIITEELEQAKIFWRTQKEVDPTADNIQALGVKKDHEGIYKCCGHIADEYPIFIVERLSEYFT